MLVEVTHCGVCHSDLHIWEGYYDIGGGKQMSLGDRGVTLPLAMGHEIVGRVAKLGPDAEGRARSATCASSIPGSAAANATSAWPRRTTCALVARAASASTRTAATAPTSSRRIRAI